jgi:hypothetical protein
MLYYHKGPRPETATTGKQRKREGGPETDYSAGGRQASGQVFRRVSRNECQDIVEEPATAQAKEETTSRLRVRDVGASTTLGKPVTYIGESVRISADAVYFYPFCKIPGPCCHSNWYDYRSYEPSCLKQATSIPTFLLV